MGLTAVSAAGYGAKVFIENAAQRRKARLQALDDEDALRRRNELLLDEYGDRSDLSALEKAVEFYEKKK
jgi:hypothetical protein